MQENELAQPSPLKHPNNPHLRLPDPDSMNVETWGLDLYVEYSGYTLQHVWVTADIDILPVLTGAQEEAIWERIGARE